MLKKAAKTVLIIFFMLQFSGCWGKTELNEIGIVVVTGIDLEPEGSIRVTVMSVQPEGSAQTTDSRSSTWIGTALGGNLMDAVKNLRAIAMKDLTWIHNSVIVIGQKAADRSMEEVVDFFSRNREVRLTSYILVAHGTAFDMLQVPADIQNSLPKEIIGIIDNAPELSKSYIANAREFMVSHSDNCGNYITGKLDVTYEKRTTFSAPRQEYGKLENTDRELPILNIEGCAVFKQGKMAGWLDPIETRGYLWLTGKIKTGTIITHADGGDLSFESSFSETSVDSRIDGDDIVFAVKVDVRGTIVQQTTGHELRRQETVEEIEEQFAMEIKKEMELCAMKLQKEYKADILKFRSLINKKYPQAWKCMEADWNDKYFSRADIRFEVNVTAERSGKLLKSIYR